jgi:hypothetical protein
MKAKTTRAGVLHLGLALALAALLLLAGGAMAQSGAGGAGSPAQDYDLSWWTVDGGGITFSEGGGYLLSGTAGQPDAGALAGGGYTLAGGFWRGGALVSPPYRVYLPLVTRNW